MNYFVYIWNTPEGIPYYVGEGGKRRCFMPRNIPSPKSRNLVQMFPCESKEVCWAYEVELISFFGRTIDGGCLLNKSLGGPGRPGAKHSEETKKLLSKKVRQRYRDPRYRLKIASIVRKRFKTSEARKQMSIASGAKPVRLLSPDSIEYVVQNINQHCREFGLFQTGMSCLITKKIRIHKGWRLAECAEDPEVLAAFNRWKRSQITKTLISPNGKAYSFKSDAHAFGQQESICVASRKQG